MNKRQRKAIDTEAIDFTIFGTQLYKHGKDHQLQFFTNEKEYLTI